MFIGVIILCAVVAVMLWIFFSYHMYLVWTGYSTNESSKKSQVGYNLYQSLCFLEDWEENKMKDPQYKPDEKSLKWVGIKADIKLTEIRKERKEVEKMLTDLDKGSIWAPSSLFRGLLFIVFPDYYFGKTP